MNHATFYCYYVIITIVITLITGCAKPSLTLMPTPVIYHDAKVDPFKHLKEEQKSTTTKVFYATNRVPRNTDGIIDYGNDYGKAIHLGKALIRMGSAETQWNELHNASLNSEKSKPVPLTLEEVTQYAVLPTDDIHPDDLLTKEQRDFFTELNTDLAAAADKEIMVYVHGTKVDFANAAILTAEIDHFAGRDFVGLAFAWPSHQNILFYLLGPDVQRARDSSSALKSMLLLLAKHTKAEQINVLAYSAGGKVVSKALAEMRYQYSNMPVDDVRKTFRLGSVVFTAADVEVDIFLNRLKPISELANQVVVTVTDNDNALISAKRFMGGQDRAGSSKSEKKEKDFLSENNITNVEIIDVSLGQQARGFDITGHHYWYRHPWTSSDIIFLMRTDLPAHRRGLAITENKSIWYLPANYPENVRSAAEIELEGQW